MTVFGFLDRDQQPHKRHNINDNQFNMHVVNLTGREIMVEQALNGISAVLYPTEQELLPELVTTEIQHDTHGQPDTGMHSITRKYEVRNLPARQESTLYVVKPTIFEQVVGREDLITVGQHRRTEEIANKLKYMLETVWPKPDAVDFEIIINLILGSSTKFQNFRTSGTLIPDQNWNWRNSIGLQGQVGFVSIKPELTPQMIEAGFRAVDELEPGTKMRVMYICNSAVCLTPDQVDDPYRRHYIVNIKAFDII